MIIQQDGMSYDGHCDAIITDPEYDNQPDIGRLLTKTKGNVIVFCDPFKRPNKQPDEILFWIKTPSTKNTTKRCSRFVEEIMVYRQGKTFNPQHWSIMTGVFTDTILSTSIHPWQKPASLLEKLISIYTNHGDTVLDPFAGSGTTGVACKRLGRNFVGCELKPDYCALAKQLCCDDIAAEHLLLKQQIQELQHKLEVKEALKSVLEDHKELLERLANND